MPGHTPSAGDGEVFAGGGRADPARSRPAETWELEQGVKYMLADPQLNRRP